MENQNMEINMIDDAALDGVTGGTSMNGYQFSGKIRPEACVIGQNYYVVIRGACFYGQAEGISHENGKTFLTLRTVSPNTMPFKFNVDIIEVYTSMMASC